MHTQKPYPPGVFHHFLVWLPIVGGVGIGVVAQLGQHGGDHWHVLQDVSWDLPHPLGQGFHVHWLDHLVCGSFNPGEGEKKIIFSIPTNYSSVALRPFGLFLILMSNFKCVFCPSVILVFVNNTLSMKHFLVIDSRDYI